MTQMKQIYLEDKSPALKVLGSNRSNCPNENYLLRKKSLSHPCEIWVQILNCSNQISAQGKIQYLPYPT